jgi:decaprenyl-phosphate phosphoribosyltransferase
VARPKQWLKNVLVFAAPGAAGVLLHRHQGLVALGAFGIFCLAASGTYFINDTLDAAADRLHPVKRHRAVASGVVPPGLAVGVGAGLVALAVGLAWLLAGTQLTVVVAVYAAIVTAYSLRLKHVPIVDLACVSSGFILRAIAGGVATQVPLTNWFIIVASFGSLLVVTGKRSAEHSSLGEDRAEHRKTLGAYPPSFLRSIRLIAAAVLITAYCQWALGITDRVSGALGRGHHPIWFELSIIPFVLAVLHLELRFETGHGAAPEDLATGDRTLQVLGLLWVALFAAGIYL